jgi:arsenate reductase
MLVNAYTALRVAPRRKGSPVNHVPFVCNHNAGRSQMAQAFFERLAPDDIRAESAGSSPARQVWPEVVEVMREVGIDLAGRKPRKLLREMQLHAD